MQKILTLIRFPISLVTASLLLTSCGPSETAVQKANREGILLVGNGADPPDLDPHIITGIPENAVAEALFEGLTRYDPVDLSPLPGVAKSWDVSDDGLVYTFHLRDNAKWSNGEPITAEDFYQSFRRILTASLASENVDDLFYVVGAEDYYKGVSDDFESLGFHVIDPFTLEFRLKAPLPFFPQVVAARPWWPVPIKLIEKFGGMDRKGTDWTREENIVGNGPFMMKEWRQGQHLSVVKNPNYWNADRVKLNGVTFFPIENLATEEAAFRSGQLHKTNKLPLAKIDSYKRDNPELLRLAPLSGTYYYTINIERKPFDDVRVRKALSMTLDREAITKQITRAGERTAYHFVPDGIGGYVSETNVPYDPEKARTLLAEAGYPGGAGFPSVTLIYNTLESHRTIAEAAQQMWKKELGIDIQLQNMEWGVYLDKIHSGDYQIARRGLIVDPYDPWLYLRAFVTGYGFNDSQYSDPEYDALIDEIFHTADRDMRMELCQKAEALMLDALPIIPIYFYTNPYLLDPSVKGWSDNLLQRLPLTETWLEE